MTTASALSLLLAIFKAVPTIEIWWERLIVAYVKLNTIKIANENRDAIIAALKEGDQREIEDDEHSGNPSGVGTFRPYLPGVVRKPKKN